MAVDATQLPHTTATQVEDVGQIPQWQLMVRRFRKSKLSVGGMYVLIVMYAIMLFSDFLAPYEHNRLDSNYAWGPPSQVQIVDGKLSTFALKQTLDTERLQWLYVVDESNPLPIQFFVQGYEYRFLAIFPSKLHLFGVKDGFQINLLGADKDGKDVLSRLLKGSQISLTLGFVGVVISVIIGSIVGTASGYFGGAIDNMIQRVIELLRSFPDIPLFLSLAAALPQNAPVEVRFFLITIIIAVIGWTGLAREVRGKVMSYRNADYTAASVAAGGSHWHIITRHLIPNSLSHIIVVGTLAIPAAIGSETALSFLGLGILPPAVSWGVMVRDAQTIEAITTYPWMLLPVLVLIITVLSFYLLGDGIRDAVDPYA
jgi:peptide/nickel transport system permease protein